MDNEITIMPGGELIETYWEYDEATQKGEYKTCNVTDKATSLMFRPVSFHKDLKLKDVLLLLKKDILFYSLYLNNWVEEFVNEGLNKSPSQTFDDVEYLELYWDVNYEEDENTKEKTIDGYIFPSLHMMSKKLTEDKHDEFGNLMYQANQRINYSVSFLPVNDLADISIRLEKKFLIANNTNFEEKTLKFDNCYYSLGHVLYGIIWELSWYGSPNDRDAQKEKLSKEAGEIKNEIK